MEITAVKQSLLDNTQRVVEYLLPNGIKQGHEWRVGSVAGEKGQSLGVHLSGQKAGVWADFSTGETGDLIDLWMKTRVLGLPEALADMTAWLGIDRPKPVRERKKDFKRPPKPKCNAPAGKVRDYLIEVRNVPAESLAKYKISERDDVIVFPFLDPAGELIMAKERKAVDKAKPVPTAKDCEPILFGWQAINPNAREIAICEGEIDAPSLDAYGWPTLSVPYGGGKGAKQQWIENEFDRMERFERIFLVLDNDEQGDQAAEEIASRLGRHRCYRVRLPLKDANECRMEGILKAAINEAFANAASLDPAGLKRASDFTNEVIHLFWPAPETPLGYRTPYAKVGDKLLFRPGEVSLWTGASGAGKSQILSDCTVDWIGQGSRVCLSSLEMSGRHSLKRMVKQMCGVDRPQPQYIENSLIWMDQGLMVYDLVGKAKIDTLIEVFDYSRCKYGCDQFIVDSLMRLGVSSDDYVGQEKAMFQLVNWAVSNNIHLHLVAHARKGAPGSTAPETEDVKGASEIGANAFNIISVWRNRKLEDDIRKAEQAKNEAELETFLEQPGVIFNIAKQRNGDFEGKIGLWFDQGTYRYYSSYDKSLWSRSYLDLAA